MRQEKGFDSRWGQVASPWRRVDKLQKKKGGAGGKKLIYAQTIGQQCCKKPWGVTGGGNPQMRVWGGGSRETEK